jgi:hypothetical protein
MGQLDDEVLSRFMSELDSRSPRPVGPRTIFGKRDSVVDCGCPLPLCILISRF